MWCISMRAEWSKTWRTRWRGVNPCTQQMKKEKNLSRKYWNGGRGALKKNSNSGYKAIRLVWASSRIVYLCVCVCARERERFDGLTPISRLGSLGFINGLTLRGNWSCCCVPSSSFDKNSLRLLIYYRIFPSVPSFLSIFSILNVKISS